MPKKKVVAQASVLKRLVAFVIDLIILNMFILFPFQDLIGNMIPKAESFSETFNFLEESGASSNILLITVIISIIAILYFYLFEKKYGQTPGKMLLKIYVVPEGKDLKGWQLVIRSIFLIPTFPFILLWIVDPIVIYFTKDNQRLTEVISKTKTVEEVSI